MTGLRERKKQEVRGRIISAAADLFAANGLDATTMEEIAAAADVSVATVYNYFGSKTTLLLAGLEDDTDVMLAAGAPVLDDPGDDPRLAVRELVGTYVEQIAGWDRDFLRELMAASFQRGGDDLAAEFTRMDERLLAQMGELLHGFKERGLLSGDVEPEEAAFLVYSTLLTALVIYLSVDRHPIAELTAQVYRQIDLAFEGLAPISTKKAKHT